MTFVRLTLVALLLFTLQASGQEADFEDQPPVDIFDPDYHEEEVQEEIKDELEEEGGQSVRAHDDHDDFDHKAIINEKMNRTTPTLSNQTESVPSNETETIPQNETQNDTTTNLDPLDDHSSLHQWDTNQTQAEKYNHTEFPSDFFNKTTEKNETVPDIHPIGPEINNETKPDIHPIGPEVHNDTQPEIHPIRPEVNNDTEPDIHPVGPETHNDTQPDIHPVGPEVHNDTQPDIHPVGPEIHNDTQPDIHPVGPEIHNDTKPDIHPVGPEIHNDTKPDIHNDTEQKPSVKPVPEIHVPKPEVNPINKIIQNATDFFDILPGNKFSHSDSLLHLRFPEPSDSFSKWFAVEYELDYFVGLLGGNFPFFSQDDYQSIVENYNLQGSLNFTSTLRFQIADFTRFEFEFNFVPAQIGVDLDFYSTSMIGDNCIWMSYNYHTFEFQTKFMKQFKQCGYNLRTFIDKADNILDIPTQMFNTPIQDQFDCNWEDEQGENWQSWKFLSGSLTQSIDILNRDEYVFTSHCFGSVSWPDFLIPPTQKGKQNDWWKSIVGLS